MIQIFKSLNKFTYVERLTGYLIVLIDMYSFNIHSEISRKLTVVKLGNHHFLVVSKYFGSILGQRIQIRKVCKHHFLTLGGKFVESGVKMSVSAAKTYYKQVGIFLNALHFKVGNWNTCHFLCS